MSEKTPGDWYYERLPIEDEALRLKDAHLEPEPEPELEFKAKHFCFETGMECKTASCEIEDLLNEGWQIDEKIICRMHVVIIFSREKEIPNNAQE